MIQYGDGRYGAAPDYGFIKFREAGARYTIPTSLADRIGASRASFAVSGRELGLWRRESSIWNSAMTGDPETTDTNRIIPPPTRWTAELNVTF